MLLEENRFFFLSSFRHFVILLFLLLDLVPTSITVYFDGKQVGEPLKNIYQQHPIFIMFDTEIMPWNMIPESEYAAYTYYD